MLNALSKARLAALCAAGAAFALMAAAPVQAKDAEDLPVAGELPAVAPVASGDYDKKFQDLFASWKEMEPQADAADVVSVPSGMPLVRATMTSGYGMRDHPVLHRRARHKGVDLAAPIGTPVHATADGIVARANRFSSYGLFVKIEHGAALETRYAHMSRLAVHEGERVHKGDVIGYVGTTGRSTGPHLHYEVRLAGNAVNPIPYMIHEDEPATKLALAEGAGGIGGGD